MSGWDRRLTTARAGLRRAAVWLDSPPSRRFCVILFGLYALHVVTGLMAHAMWHDELQAWLIVRDSGTPAELARRLAYEGHPLGWYLLLWPFRFLGRDPAWMQVVAGACALGAMALLFARGPFSRLELLLLPLSYPLVFEYAVKSRSYALGNLVLFVFCAAFVARRSTFWLALLLAVLVNVHAMFGLIALGGVSAVVVRRWQETGWRSILQRADGAAVIVLMIGAVVAVAVAWPPPDSGFAMGWAFDLDRAHVDRTMSALVALVGGGAIWQGLAPTAPFVGLMLCALFLARGPRAPAAAAFFGTAVLGLLAFMHVKWGLAPWHSALLVVVLVAAVWLGRGEQGPSGPALLPRPVFAAVLAVQAWVGVSAAVNDRSIPFSAARETAHILIDAGLRDAPVFALHDEAASGVIAYLGVPTAFYGPGWREGSYVIWDKARLVPVDVAALVDRAAAVPRAVVLDCKATITEAPPDPRLVEWRRVEGAAESCVIYRVALSRPGSR
ncbi:hypothetical protein NML43_03615 [Rhodopseudomonas palustris]|uniref:hypothetical protein n=1 Tax=Rhodopseudomonas palustris TaxID=1076 RepID=UPI0020CDC6AE|nr:hypothetical protein [Rhodopseudomonas palustris]MCP9626174.1 hypothetical protein [Rhodopseudomonas palustris]